MKILHLTSFDRWTGASAPAFAEVEALRETGLDAHYAFAGGSSLEEKVGERPFTHAILHRAQTPRSVIRSVSALRRLVNDEGFDVIHCHLSHDHWLGYIARRQLAGVSLVRTFHASRALRADLLTRHLVSETDAVAVVSPALSHHPLIAARHAIVTPPPAEPQYRPGDDVRTHLGIPKDVPLLGFIGKISPGRGFEDAIRIFANVRGKLGDARLMIIGRGEHATVLRRLAAELGVSDGIIWAGYHEHDLPEHFRAIDVLLFTAPGSDEGHRAIIESMSCGTPVASYPLAGIPFVLGELAPSLISPEGTPESLGSLVAGLIESRSLESIPAAALRESSRFSYREASARLLELYRIAAGRHES